MPACRSCRKEAMATGYNTILLKGKKLQENGLLRGQSVVASMSIKGQDVVRVPWHQSSRSPLPSF